MNHKRHQSLTQQTHINQFKMNNYSSIYPFEIKKFDSSEDLIEKPLRSLLKSHQRIDIINEQSQQEAQTCLICFNTVSNPQMEAVPTCGHRFCKVCLNKHIRNNLHQCKIANCPLEQCNEPINYSPQFFKGINTLQQKKYARMEKYLLLINSQQQRICPKQDCEGTFSIKTNPTNCIVCNEQFCSICYHKFHQGQCDQNGIKYLSQNYHFRQCSKCKMMLQKIDGCPHMTCKCGHQFCYLCGSEWQPKHNCTGIPIAQGIQEMLVQLNYEIHNDIRRLEPIVIDYEPNYSKVCIFAFIVVGIIMVMCLPFDLIAFFSIRIIKGFVEMVRKYKWYQIVLGNVILLLICIAERTINGIYYCNCEEIVRFFQPISYKIIKAFQRAINPYF